MLAYVFVHRPAAAADRREYLTRLRSFHDALAAAPSRGLRRSWVWQVETGPLGEAFEDWHLVENWAALGALNQAAVTGPRKAPHDEVAPRAAEGVGAIYGLMHGEPVDSASYRLKVTEASWARPTRSSRRDCGRRPGPPGCCGSVRWSSAPTTSSSLTAKSGQPKMSWCLASGSTSAPCTHPMTSQSVDESGWGCARLPARPVIDAREAPEWLSDRVRTVGGPAP